MSDVIITDEKPIAKKKTTEKELIETLTELWDALSDDQKIKTQKPRLYRKPMQEIKGRPRKKRRRKR